VRPLTILMLSSSYPKWPGEATAPFIESIASGLARRGHTVHVVLPSHPDLRRSPIDHGVHLHPFRYAPHPALSVWGYAGALNADVGLKGAALAAAPFALAASLWGLLRRAPRADIIHAHWVLPNGLPALAAARIRRLPLVVSLHGSDVYMAEKPAFTGAARAIFHAAGAISACSGDLRDRAIRLGADPARTETVPYGVDPGAFRPDPDAALGVRRELELAPDAPLVVSVSRLVYKKGLTFLLDAMPELLRRHPGATLVLGGYGDLRDDLERRAQALGVQARVRFPGQLSRDRAAAYIGAADVHVVPSIRDQGGNLDGLPNVLLEGMSAARPIVASAIAGIPDVITSGVHGLLVPEQSAPALAEAIAALLDDRGLARRLGDAARRRVIDELTWDAATARFERLYERALAQRDRRADG
jgi:glycosyltransferase involved in cell wall biosynthesis